MLSAQYGWAEVSVPRAVNNRFDHSGRSAKIVHPSRSSTDVNVGGKFEGSPKVVFHTLRAGIACEKTITQAVSSIPAYGSPRRVEDLSPIIIVMTQLRVHLENFSLLVFIVVDVDDGLVRTLVERCSREITTSCTSRRRPYRQAAGDGCCPIDTRGGL